MKKNQYVVPTDDGWGVRGENNEKLTKKFDKKNDAIDYAKNIAKKSAIRINYSKKEWTDSE